MKTTICTSLLLLLGIILSAQDKFYARSDFGMSNAIISSNIEEITGTFHAPNHVFSTVDGIWGFYLGGSVYKNLNIEFGVNYQVYSDKYTAWFGSYGFGGRYGGSKSFIILPLNASYHFNILNSKFFVIPHLGISFITPLYQDNYRTDITFDNMESSNNIGTINDTIRYTTFTTKPSSDYSFLLNAGVGLEYRMNKRLGITLNGNYSFGLNEITRFVILSKEGNNKTYRANLSYKGTHYYFACGLKYYF